MLIDDKILLHSLAKTFHSNLGINVSAETEKYIKKTKSNNMSQDDKLYYTAYALKLAQSLTEYVPKITMLSVNMDVNAESNFNFEVTSKQCGTKCVSFSKPISVIHDLIPKKLMKICKYRKNSKIHEEYTTAYDEICAKIYSKIKSKSKYSEITDDYKQKRIYKPIVELVEKILTKKRKCANNLYSHLVKENERILVKLCKKRFLIYDFGTELPEVKSFKLKSNDLDEIVLTFSNGAIFTLTLRTNATDIKEELSLKFHTKFNNLDELFAVKVTSI